MTQPGAATAGAPSAAAFTWVSPPREALDYPVLFDPAPAVARWRGLRRLVVSRVIGLVLSGGIWAVLWWLSRDNLWEGFWWVLGVSMGLSVLWLAHAIVSTVLARRDIARLHEGLALGIGRGGLFLDGFLPWSHLASMEAKPAGHRGSVRLVITSICGVRGEVPLEWLSQTPAAIDGAVRALSGRRFAVDLTTFDRRPRRPRRARRRRDSAANRA